MEWVRANWPWILFAVFFVWMHMGHGGHGGHGAGGHRHESEREDQEAGRNGTTGLVVGLAESFLYGVYAGLVYVPVHNALSRRWGRPTG